MPVAIAVKQWTLDELHRLPDDGNKYELVRGKLFVTPAPTNEHETIAARLTRILDPSVEKHGLGMVYRPRAVLRFAGSEAEPDLMVRQPHPKRRGKWDDAPTPILVVEILSPYTGRRDREDKREYYMDAGVEEYWIIDPERDEVTAIHRDAVVVTTTRLEWLPPGVTESLVVDVRSLFEGF